jgi:hypothetical protein
MLDAAIDQFRAASKAVELSVRAVQGSKDESIASNTVRALVSLLASNVEASSTLVQQQEQQQQQQYRMVRGGRRPSLEHKDGDSGTGLSGSWSLVSMACPCPPPPRSL